LLQSCCKELPAIHGKMAEILENLLQWIAT